MALLLLPGHPAMTTTSLLGLTTLGIIHTAISLVAVGCGAVAFIRDKAILPSNRVGQLYVYTTILTCVTGFGIFQHGGFGAPHALGVITLLVLGIASLARRSILFGRWCPHVMTACYSTTFFFHMIPGVTETTTRLPVGAPLIASQDAPELQKIIGALFLVLLVGITLQLLRLNATISVQKVSSALKEPIV